MRELSNYPIKRGDYIIYNHAYNYVIFSINLLFSVA